MQIVTTSSEQTEQLGARIGAKLRGGEYIELVSDLGGGKTTFTRGVAKGAGSGDAVASPTFTLSREYTCPSFTIMHFDFYRLAEAGVMAEELSEYLGDSAYVVVSEWSDVVKSVLPTDRLQVRIETTGDDRRTVYIQCPTSRAYLLGTLAGGDGYADTDT